MLIDINKLRAIGACVDGIEKAIEMAGGADKAVHLSTIIKWCKDAGLNEYAAFLISKRKELALLERREHIGFEVDNVTYTELVDAIDKRNKVIQEICNLCVCNLDLDLNDQGTVTWSVINDLNTFEPPLDKNWSIQLFNPITGMNEEVFNLTEAKEKHNKIKEDSLNYFSSRSKIYKKYSTIEPDIFDYEEVTEIN